MHLSDENNPFLDLSVNSQREKDEMRVKRDLEGKFQAEHPFHPNLNYDQVPSEYRYQPTEERKGDIFTRLSSQDEKKNYILRQLMIDKQEKLKEECPFAPKVYSRRGPYGYTKIPVTERLMQDAKQREKKRELLEEASQQPDEECTFHPQLQKPKVQLASYQPLEQRVPSIIQAKQEEINKQEKEQLAEHSFKPHISAESERLAAQSRQSSVPVSERLFQDAALAAELTQTLKKQQDKNELEGCTFKPEIDPISEAVVEDGEFFKRQHDALKKKEEFRITAENGGYLDPECTFQPNIDSSKFSATQSEKPSPGTSKKGKINFKSLSRSNSSTFPPHPSSYPVRATVETQQQRCYRMSVTAAKVREEKIKELEQQKEREMQRQFHPHIDRISSLLARPRSVDEMSKAVEVQRAKKLAEEKVLQEEREKCTFHPQLISKTPRERPHTTGTTPYSNKTRPASAQRAGPWKEQRHIQLLESVNKANDERQRKLIEEKKQKEYESLKECTFQPVLIARRGRSQSAQRSKPPVTSMVKGMDRFMELKRMAEQKKKEELKTLSKVFHMDGCREMDISSGKGKLAEINELARRSHPP